MAAGNVHREGRPAFQVRELRRKEGEAFLTHVVANAGEMDRALDLLDRSIQELRGVFSPGIWTLLGLLRTFGRSPVRFLVADAGGEIVGTTLVVLLGPWAYVAAVGVSPNHRRQGIADALVTEAEEMGRRAHKPWLVLDVDADNAPAKALYAKLGFSSGLRVDWWRLPLTPTRPEGAPGGKAEVRLATAQDRKFATERALGSLAVPLPPRHVHPAELACQGRRDTSHDWATGPPGAPDFFARTYLSRWGASSYLLGVPGEKVTASDAQRVIAAGREDLARSATKAVFVPIRDSDAVTRQVLEEMGSSRVAASETWWKSLTLPRRRLGPVALLEEAVSPAPSAPPATA